MGNVPKGWKHDRQRHGIGNLSGFWARNVGSVILISGKPTNNTIPVGCPVIFMCDTRANEDLGLEPTEHDTYIGICRKYAGAGADIESLAVAGVVQGTTIPYLGVGHVRFDGRISNLLVAGNCSNGDWLRISNEAMYNPNRFGLAQRATAGDAGDSHCFAIACKTITGANVWDEHAIPAILTPWRQ